MGNTTLHYHGRIIENIRVGNLDDCYTINGWAAPHLSNQAEVADLYRNPVGDPDVMAYYCRPLYVAVKLRDRVAPTGSTVTADIYLVNEANLKGPHELAVSLVDERGRKLFGETYNVNITGGEEYGQLLAEGINLTLGDTPGYQTVEAVLRDRGGAIRADGRDEAYAIDLPVDDISRNGAVADTSGAVNRFLGSVCGFTLPDYSGDTGNLNYIVVGPTGIINANRTAALMERVANGAVAVVVSDAGRFAEMLTSETMEAVDYRGQFNAVRGKFVAGKHELLDGLPQGKAFDWEHQIFYRNPRRNISAMKLYGVKTLVAAVSDNQKEAGTALTVVPYGRGAFVLSTLAVLPFLEDKTPQSIAAKRLFLNYLRYAGKRR